MNWAQWCGSVLVVSAMAGCGAAVSPGDGGDAEASVGMDTGTDGSVTNPTSCSNAGCEAGMICVRTLFEGGALLLPDDAGNCPEGRANVNGQCQSLPTFRCVSRPSTCTSMLSCTCASTVCSSGYQCATPTNDEIDCTLLAP